MGILTCSLSLAIVNFHSQLFIVFRMYLLSFTLIHCRLQLFIIIYRCSSSFRVVHYHSRLFMIIHTFPCHLLLTSYSQLFLLSCAFFWLWTCAWREGITMYIVLAFAVWKCRDIADSVQKSGTGGGAGIPRAGLGGPGTAFARSWSTPAWSYLGAGPTSLGPVSWRPSDHAGVCARGAAPDRGLGRRGQAQKGQPQKIQRARNKMPRGRREIRMGEERCRGRREMQRRRMGYGGAAGEADGPAADAEKASTFSCGFSPSDDAWLPLISPQPSIAWQKRIYTSGATWEIMNKLRCQKNSLIIRWVN
jgi:hypothetical protein